MIILNPWQRDSSFCEYLTFLGQVLATKKLLKNTLNLYVV